jgi:uncharacterized 2Fe-2S/4Fe-4S cluster protein (DUF4445 family)
MPQATEQYMKHSITFLPDNITVTVNKGDNLLNVAADAGVYVHAYCGGDGVCGKCKVLINKGEVRSDKANLKQEDWDKGYRLACLSSVESNLEVTIPEMTSKSGKALKRKPKTTRTVSAKSLDDLIGQWEIEPPVSKLYLELAPPSMNDNISDMDRVMRGIKQALPEHIGEPSYDHPELVKHLPSALREANWKITLLLLRRKRGGFRIIDVEAGNTTAKLYGLAVDIGTTTCSGVLVDLVSGEILAESSGYNGQISCGEDVISRIVYAGRPGGLRALQDKVVGTVNTIIEDICQKMIISPADIAYMMAAGNTVMSHLLLGLDPKYIREAPYVPSVSQFPLTKAADLGIQAHPSMRLFLYPCIASYVGGDIVSGVHACQMAKSDKVSLFIDIGTNGEIVVGNQDWMVCAACSAGPAFEGGGIQYGMRASSGAIENFQIHPDGRLYSVPRIDPGFYEIRQDIPGVAVGVLDEIAAAGVDSLALPPQTRQDELAESVEPHDGTAVVRVVIGDHYAVNAGIEEGVDVRDRSADVYVCRPMHEGRVGDHAYQEFVHAHGCGPGEGAVYGGPGHHEMGISQLCGYVTDGIQLRWIDCEVVIGAG